MSPISRYVSALLFTLPLECLLTARIFVLTILGGACLSGAKEKVINFERAARGVWCAWRMVCVACAARDVRAKTVSFCNPMPRAFALSSVPTRTN